MSNRIRVQRDVADYRLPVDARPVLKTSGGTMVIRRIVGSVCALCLAAPAGAVASPGTDPPLPRGPYGVTAVTGPPSNARVAKGPYGVTSVTGPLSAARAKGPYGV